MKFRSQSKLWMSQRSDDLAHAFGHRPRQGSFTTTGLQCKVASSVLKLPSLFFIKSSAQIIILDGYKTWWRPIASKFLRHFYVRVNVPRCAMHPKLTRLLMYLSTLIPFYSVNCVVKTILVLNPAEQSHEHESAESRY